MKLLETTFTKKGFVHTLVQRNCSVAVYRRQKIGGKAVHFETVIIGSHNGYVLAGASDSASRDLSIIRTMGHKRLHV